MINPQWAITTRATKKFIIASLPNGDLKRTPRNRALRAYDEHEEAAYVFINELKQAGRLVEEALFVGYELKDGYAWIKTKECR